MNTIRDVLKERKRKLETIQKSASVADAIDRFGKIRMRCLVVTEGDTLEGIVSIRDLLRFIGEHGADALEGEISAVMTRGVTTVTPDTRLDAAATLLAEADFNHLPVVEDGAVVGLVTPADVLHSRVAHVQTEASYLRDYIAGVYY